MTNDIYIEDCLRGMRELIADESIDLVITDPPYGMGKEFEKGINLNYLIKAVFLECFNKLKNNRFMVYTCPCNKVDFFIEATKSAGFNFERVLFYYKKAKFTDVWMGWLLKSEAILIFSKGHPNKSNSNRQKYCHDVYVVEVPISTAGNFVEHKSAKSESVWRHLIQILSKENDVVLDPFLGSGTTLVVCRQLKRKVVGFEINPEYKQLRGKRLKQKNIRDFFEHKKEILQEATI